MTLRPGDWACRLGMARSATRLPGASSPIGGAGTGQFSVVHIDEAARATARAVEHGRTGIFNIVDSHPAPLDMVVVLEEHLTAGHTIALVPLGAADFDKVVAALRRHNARSISYFDFGYMQTIPATGSTSPD